jgi:hypothetical protein
MINKVIVLESLNYTEKKTGQELYDDILIRYNEYYNGANSDIDIRFYDIRNKAEFRTLLTELSKNILEHDEVILHFEAHGNKNGLVLSNDEQINWIDFSSFLMEINKNTNNNLHLTMATCYGRYMYKVVEKNLSKVLPFKTLISASTEIYPSEILEDYSLFFQYLVKERNITEAYKALNGYNSSSNFIYHDTEATIKLWLDHIFEMAKKFPFGSPTKQFLEGLLGIEINEYELNLELRENRESIKHRHLNKLLMKNRL